MICNILLLGQTGVGKSSLLNYLAGEDLAEAGIASGIGGLTRGINKYPLVLNNQKCLVSDSEGLELTDSNYWLRLIDKELFNKDVQSPIGDWYHIVVYCIGANGGRVQDFELKILDKVIEAGYGTIVAFTKADLATEEELASLKQIVEDHCSSGSVITIPVCSKKTRHSCLEGREELCEAIIESWGTSIICRVPSYVYDPVFESLQKWFDSTCDWIYAQKIGFFGKSQDKVLDELSRKIQGKQDSINHTIRTRQKQAVSQISEVYQALSDVMDVKALKASMSTNKLKIEKLNSGSVFDNTVGDTILESLGAVLLTTVPVIGIPLTVLNLIRGIKNKDKRTQELIDAFCGQYERIVDNYNNRMSDFMNYLIEHTP